MMGTTRLGQFTRALSVLMPLILATGCAGAGVPGGRDVSIPTATPPVDRVRGLNEERDAVTRVKLGRDVLVPRRMSQDPLPHDEVGPYELRGETLASALQMILDDYDVTLAFESDMAMTTRVSVANLHGPLSNVIARVCDLANLYCNFKGHTLTVKDTETFIVDMPPMGAASASSTGSATSGTTSSSSTSGSSSSGSGSWAGYDRIVAGLEAIVGGTPTIDDTTRVMIYTATQRSQTTVEEYFERLRKNMAMIVFDTNIWEVSLNNENRTGIDWTLLLNKGNFNFDIQFPGAVPDGTGTASPITITPGYTGNNAITPTMVLGFISEHGAVKTISQPQLSVLSGASATLAVSQTQNFVSGVQRTPSTTPGVPDTVSTTTQTLQTGLTINVNGAWHDSTIYGNLGIVLNDLLGLDSFKPDVNTTIQLPRTNSRNLTTQIRVRPGDAILIGGLVTQRDNYTGSGPGFMKPLFPTSRDAATSNTELVFLLRPRVVIYEAGDEGDTLPVVNAPKDGFHPLEPDLKANGPGDAGSETGILAAPVAVTPAEKPAPPKPGAPLPSGISPDALAPSAAPAPPGKKGAPQEDMPVPTVPAEDMAPVPLGAKKGGKKS